MFGTIAASAPVIYSILLLCTISVVVARGHCRGRHYCCLCPVVECMCQVCYYLSELQCLSVLMQKTLEGMYVCLSVLADS